MIEEIQERAMRCAELAQELDEARDRLQEIEDMVTTNVLGERDSGGKAVYSNETSRAIAIRHGCKQLASWQQQKDKVDALELIKAAEQIKLELYRNQFAKWKLEHRRETATIEAVNA